MRGGGDQCWRGAFILHSFQTRSWRPSSAFSRMISASTEAISSCVLPASSRASSVWLPRALALGVRTSWCGSAGAGPSACRISSSRRCFASDLRDSVRLSPARSNGVTKVSRRKGGARAATLTLRQVIAVLPACCALPLALQRRDLFAVLVGQPRVGEQRAVDLARECVVQGRLLVRRRRLL